MVTIKEIAKYCGVSIATVSNIINGKPNASEATKQKVLKAIDELNYTPNYVAKNLAKYLQYPNSPYLFIIFLYSFMSSCRLKNIGPLTLFI